MRNALVIAALLVSTIAAAGQPTMRPTDEARGEELYRRHCVACHGVRNGGQGPATTALVHPVPALQGKVKPTDPHLVSVLKGKGAMPGFEASFDRQDAVRVLKYMKSLGPDKALPARPSKGGDKTPTKRPPPKALPAEPVEKPAEKPPQDEPAQDDPTQDE